MAIKISILIPVYNTAAYLQKCLDSVVGQDYQELEIIVVNDGSTDNSLEILERYAGKITIISQPNAGLQSARKTGIANATGDFLAFVDSDDSLPSIDVVSKLASAITETTQIVAGRINIDTGRQQKLFPSAVFTTIPTRKYMQDYLLCGRAGWNLWGKLFATELIKSVANNPIKVTAGEDALYTISLANAASGQVAMVNTPVYNYFIRPGSITQSRNSRFIYDNFKVADYIDNLLAESVEAKYRVAFRLLCMSNSFRYGWLGAKSPLNANAIKLYKKTKGVLPLFACKKRLQIWILIHFGDVLSKLVFKNKINEE